MKKIFFMTFAILAAGCAVDQFEIPTMSSVKLCDYYSKPMSPNYFDPAIRDELVRRGHADCTSPAAMATRSQADMEMLNLSQKLLEQGQWKTVGPTPINCVSTQNGNQVNTNCN
jgi:hypothetical protein